MLGLHDDDHAAVEPGNLLGELERLALGVALEDVEAPELFLRLGERPVGDLDLPVAAPTVVAASLAAVSAPLTILSPARSWNAECCS